MLFAAATSTARELDAILADLVPPLQSQLQGAPVDLLIAFFSPHFARHAARVALRVRAALAPRVFIGCTAEGVIGKEHELEDQAAVALVAAHMPGVDLTPFAFQKMDWMDVAENLVPPRLLLGNPPDPKAFIVLADPFSTPTDIALNALNSAYPGVPVVGGMVSGSSRPGGNVLLLDDRALAAGTVGVALSGPVQVDVVLSQACRPIGRPYRVTEAQENVVYGLDEASPLEQVETLVASLPERDRDLLESGLLFGRAANPSKGGLGRGDFLIRSVVGANLENGSLIMGDQLAAGDIIQFHVRDAVTATEDLSLVMTPQLFFEPPCGALLFTCNSRGNRLYGHPDGDLGPIQSMLGHVPLAGFFCAGELAPLAGRNAVHGHTACLALFREK